MPRARSPRVKQAVWAVAAGLVALTLILLSGKAPQGKRHTAVATSGHALAEADDSPATLHDLETATGAVDRNELIGRRVDFHVKVAGVGSGGSFWVGSKDNRMLVVSASPDGSPPVTSGQTARITGTIEGLPNGAVREELKDQKVYIRADNVIPE